MNFNLSKFGEGLIRNYQKESDKNVVFNFFVQYYEHLHNLQNNLPFLPERMKIEKVQKLVAYLHDKNENFFHIRNFKQALNHGLNCS